MNIVLDLQLAVCRPGKQKTESSGKLAEQECTNALLVATELKLAPEPIFARLTWPCQQRIDERFDRFALLERLY